MCSHAFVEMEVLKKIEFTLPEHKFLTKLYLPNLQPRHELIMNDLDTSLIDLAETAFD